MKKASPFSESPDKFMGGDDINKLFTEKKRPFNEDPTKNDDLSDLFKDDEEEEILEADEHITPELLETYRDYLPKKFEGQISVLDVATLNQMDFDDFEFLESLVEDKGLTPEKLKVSLAEYRKEREEKKSMAA